MNDLVFECSLTKLPNHSKTNGRHLGCVFTVVGVQMVGLVHSCHILCCQVQIPAKLLMNGYKDETP